MKHRIVDAIVIVGVVALASIASAGITTARHSPAASHATVALSNSFIGNSWRKQMVGSFIAVAKQAQRQGKIKSFAVVNADNTVSSQIAEINGLILKHVGAIVLDAASPTALNGVIAKAHQAGIYVVSFDGTVTSPYSYNLVYDFSAIGRRVANFIAHHIKERGNVLLVRGVAGTIIDQQQYSAWIQTLKKYPKIHIAATVYGNWDDATAEAAVAHILPSLPKISGVLIDGGGYGVAQAFAAAHRPIPVIYLGNRGSELQWWWKQYQKHHYITESASTDPASSEAAFWVAVDLLNGYRFNHTLKMPFLIIPLKDLPKYKDVPFNKVATQQYTNQWVLSHFKPSHS